MHPSSQLLHHLAPLRPVSGSPGLLAHQAGDVFALWLAWEAERGAMADVPYWALVWPAAQVLAQYLDEHPQLTAGRRVLDCGCGGGVVAIAAMAGGAAQAVGCDLDETAIWLATRNADANGVRAEFVRQDAITACDANRFDLILVADLFYQRDFSQRLFAALQQAQQAGGEVIIADSGRPFLPKEELVEIHAETVATSFDVEGRTSRTVRLYRCR